MGVVKLVLLRKIIINNCIFSIYLISIHANHIAGHPAEAIGYQPQPTTGNAPEDYSEEKPARGAITARSHVSQFERPILVAEIQCGVYRPQQANCKRRRPVFK